MTFKKNRILLILASTFFLSACSTSKISMTKPEEINREIASNDNCFAVLRSIIHKDPKEGRIVKKDIERRFTRESASSTDFRQKQLDLLNKKYKNIDSLLDYRSHAHLPINDVVKIVDRAEDGLLAKIMLIRKAKKSIDLTYFLFDDSLSPLTLLHELRLAAKRGVKIRILYDPVGSKLGTTTPRVGIPEDLKALADLKGRPIIDDHGNPTGQYANIEIKQFNPMWKPGKMIEKYTDLAMNLTRRKEDRAAVDITAWNNRIHDKILLIDGEDLKESMLMTGGRNLNDSYYHLKHSFEDTSTEPTTDFEIILKGSTYLGEDGNAQNDMLDQFNRIFYARANFSISEHVRQINDDIVKTLSTNPDKAAVMLSEIRKKEITEFRRLRAASREVLGYRQKDAYGNIVINEGLFQKRLKELEDEGFLENGFEKAEYKIFHEVQNLTGNWTALKPIARNNTINQNSIEKNIFEKLLGAHKTITIITPYFWIEPKQGMELVAWLKANPMRKLKLISNSFLSTDSLVSQVVVEDAFGTLNKLFKEHGVLSQTDLRVIGKEDDELLKANGKEYGFLHAKVYIADDTSLISTTSNLDPISRLSNSEVGVVVDFVAEEAPLNLARLRAFVNFVEGISTNVHGPEYQRMLDNPNAKVMLRKLAIYKALAINLGLLHLL